MILCLDIGNSRVKWATRRHGQAQASGALEIGDPEMELRLATELAQLPTPERVVVSSVARQQAQQACDRVAQSLWGLRPTYLGACAAQCGVRSAYSEPEQMGVDRWLAMIAAWNARRRAVCVVDAGTAITLDVVAADGRHEGGLIVPGIELARRALLGATARIEARPVAPEHALGRSTTACVANGSVLSAAGMVQAVLGRSRGAREPTMDLVVTGGAAGVLLPGLPGAVHVPGLVFDGMELADLELHP